jgi:hypothetical protein
MSDLETRISLEDFQRHFVSTHMKDQANRIVCELHERAVESQRPFPIILNEWIASNFEQTGYRDDSWFAKEINLERCYCAHTDFRLQSIPKDGRFVDFLPKFRKEIDSGCFPLSFNIRAPWSGAMPEPLAQERSPAQYYILDGQLRVIRHWYHGIQRLKVFLYKGQGSV